MKRAKKIVAGIVLSLLLVAVLALLLVNRLARVAIEAAGTRALGVTTTLAEIDLGIFSGNSSMQGLQIDNPADFKSSYFLKLDRGAIDLSLSAVMGDMVEIPQLRLSGIHLNLVKQQGQANFRAIMDNVKRFESGDAGPAEETQRKKFLVRELVIENIEVHLDLLPRGGQLTQLNVPIKELRLENVGSDGVSGATLARITITIVKALLHAVLVKGESILPEEVLMELAERLAELKPLEALRARLEDLNLKDFNLKDLDLKERLFPEGPGGRLRNLRQQRRMRREDAS